MSDDRRRHPTGYFWIKAAKDGQCFVAYFERGMWFTLDYLGPYILDPNDTVLGQVNDPPPSKPAP